MKRLKENTVYTQKEVFEILNITQCTWNKRRQDWLKYFESFCEYEIQIGARGAYLIKINHILEDTYIPLPRKLAKTPKEIIQKDYDQQTVIEIKKEPYQTVSTLAIKTRSGTLTANYNHSQYTAEKYVRNSVNNETIIHKGMKEWRQLVDGSFIPLTPAQLVYLKQLFKDNFKDASNIQEDIYAGVEAGEITEADAIKLSGEIGFQAYNNALHIFEKEYHFRPKKVYCYEINSFAATSINVT